MPHSGGHPFEEAGDRSTLLCEATDFPSILVVLGMEVRWGKKKDKLIKYFGFQSSCQEPVDGDH